MRKYLTAVLKYFAFFSYAPSFSEIYTFFPKKITKKDLRTLLTSPANHYSLATSYSRYTLPQYSISRTIQIYLFILKHLPFVRFVGITGATAMNGYSPSDDVDLFIITQKQSLWTTRFLVVVLAKLLGIYGGVNVCLNLFFDERDMVIPIVKQNSYIAHELLQMKPILDRQNTYSLLIETNRWIFNYFPNAKQSVILGTSTLCRRTPGSITIWHPFEWLFKAIQLPIIKRNKTGFRITDHQLWLFKRDFEIKLKRNGLGR